MTVNGSPVFEDFLRISGMSFSLKSSIWKFTVPKKIPKNSHNVTLANLYALLWWIRHTEAGIMLDVVDTPCGGGVLC